MKVNILGAEYTIELREEKDDPLLDGRDGYCDYSIRLIVVAARERQADDQKDPSVYQKQVIRHELMHAFLDESGLAGSTSYAAHWATNEEMIDWMSIQLPKILKACEEAQAL